ncbi:uncharacterized protein K441DRAFT_667909 [Cenococcum geophilum 1.58]|uniref:uncharacterized protein n=1 Tax=Cenococcum geophilum 1.58 TaxID=794803 RepID=UPI00358E3425|nr:hypothetical protein K441DRAFT_667909 [Cenococcum geophilum 1.58]
MPTSGFPLDYADFHNGKPALVSDGGDDCDDEGGSLLEEEVDNFLAWTGAEPLSPKTVFVLVMGMTGSGKSTFILRCTGKSAKIGHDLFSCTESLGIFSFQFQGTNVNLIDTPGFDDTHRSDIDTLKLISHYLSVSYSNNVFISGIIYLHRISDNRVSGSTKRNIEMLKGLCGSHAFRNVNIVTTMWKGGEAEEGLRKENQLRSEDSFFGDMLSRGAHLFRHATNSVSNSQLSCELEKNS